jgi:hypothetical protein
MPGQQNVSFIGACHEATMHAIHVTTVMWLTYEPYIDTANSTTKHGELLCLYVIVLCFRVYVNLRMVMLIEHLSSLNFRMMK